MEDYELSVITATLSFVGYPEEVDNVGIQRRWQWKTELSVITGTLSFVCRLSRGGGNGRL